MFSHSLLKKHPIHYPTNRAVGRAHGTTIMQCHNEGICTGKHEGHVSRYSIAATDTYSRKGKQTYIDEREDLCPRVFGEVRLFHRKYLLFDYGIIITLLRKYVKIIYYMLNM